LTFRLDAPRRAGKTKTINHFLINDAWYMVDLPGYGFAKANAKNKLEWFGFSSEYFMERKALIMVMLLVDASIPPQQSDVECLRWMADREVRKKGTWVRLIRAGGVGATPCGGSWGRAILCEREPRCRCRCLSCSPS
jgi:hypothetical protein